MGALLSGRSRIEVTAPEADQALTWAGGLAGWSGMDPKPLFVHYTGSRLPALSDVADDGA